MSTTPVAIHLKIEHAELLLKLIESGPLDGSSLEIAEEIRKAHVAALLKHKRESDLFDVFLCHNSVNKPHVKKIGEKLKARGLLPWLDEWEFRPGIPWQKSLQQKIKTIKAAAVFVGKDGIGPWQDRELEAFISQFVKRECPVIPVLLRSCKKKPDLPIFLDGMTYVDLRKKRPDPLEQLIWGITGVHPDSQPAAEPQNTRRSKAGDK